MYILGLDIGITSVGYAILNADSNGEPNRIIKLGSRIFDAAENPKDGSPLAEPRREARGARRRNRRHRHRMERIKALLQNEGVITKQALQELYTQKNLTDIYEIRYNALDNRLGENDFARLLIHYAQRRGFKSNRKNEAGDKEGGKLLKATAQNTKYFAENNYRTIGEMLFKDAKYTDIKRNKGGDYSNTFLRSEIEQEIRLVLANQKSLGNPFVTDEFTEKYMDILLSQRAFDEGPGAGPYSGDQIKKMVGKCTFEPAEDRAAKASYTFEYYNLLSKINNLCIVGNGKKTPLTKDQRKQLEELCLKTELITYDKIRKLLKLSDDESFNILKYGDKKTEEVEKAKFQYLTAYHEMRKAFDKIEKGYIAKVSIEKRDAIGVALTYYKTDAKIKEYLSNFDFTSQEIEAVEQMKSFAKVCNLSIKAMTKIIPFLQQGETYDKASGLAGYDFKAHQKQIGKYLPKLGNDVHEVTSPVVKRAINQTIKVVNAIIKSYGSPVAINIELAREMSKTREERDKIDKENKENQAVREKACKEIKELGVSNPKTLDIIKYNLYKEQGERCIYTNTPLEVEHLFEPGYYEIDHIIPYSISVDDKYTNKVLVTTAANREKGNRIPMDYVKDKNEYINLVKTLIKNSNKRANLLKESILEEDYSGMKDRNLQDTKFISKFMLNYINDNLQFDKALDKKKRVKAVNGSVTSYMRKRWNLNKMRENGDLHHAIDACVVACITDGTIQKVTWFSKCKEDRRFIDKNNASFNEKHFPRPWEGFTDEIDIRTSPKPQLLLEGKNLTNYQDVDITKISAPFVSRMVRNKNNGQAHKDTIRSYREVDGEMKTVTKTALQSLKYDAKNDEIVGYYNPDSDRLLYELLKEKLKQANGDAKKAFPEGKILKPAPKGGPISCVKKVKTVDVSNLNVDVNDGVAANGDMVRIDVFKVENDGYYFVPIYVSDLVLPQLPNKACVAYKPYAEWKEMNEEDFLFSIHPNDLIKFTAKSPKTFTKVFKEAKIPDTYDAAEEFVYYKCANIATGAICIINNDNSYTIKGLGIKTLTSIEKYYVDVLGNIFKAGKEKRK